MQTVSKLAPDQAAAAMPGVDRAADRKIGEEQQRLDAAPPTRERPSGAPQTRSAPPEAAPEAAQVTGKVERIGPEDQGDKQKAKGGDKAEGKEATADVPPPAAPAVPDKGLSEAEAKNVEAAADAVPTTDPELENKTVGPAPKIRLEGASDPTRTDDQAKALKDKQSDLQTTGREDAAKPLGEDQIFPNAPAEQLHGKASGGAGGGKAGALEATPAPKAGVGAVAKQEKGTEITGGAGKAQGDLDAKDKEHQQSEQQAKQDKQTEINSEVERNTAQQTAERGRVAQETRKQREDWRGEQDKKVEDADKQSDDEHGKKNKEIVKARDDKDKEVGERKDKDNASIDTERENAEKEAQKKKEEKKKPSGGLFGWIADKVADFFKGLLAAVTAVFDAARKAVNGIIDQFKEWANQAIDFVRDLAIKAINALADVLIAIGDTLLAAFPELRDRFRKAIEGLRDAAIAKVNQLADSLKKAVNALLDVLAAGLNKLLDVLEAGVKAVIKAYQAIIVGAIKFAQAAIEALGKFAALVADIAPDPGGWISKAGSSAKTGITDHLWGAIKVAVKGWFDTKVEGILGLGKAVIDVLVKGCVSIKQIGKMAWEAITASLPMMIATLVIEKVVSMIVPAAGAILTIIQGLMAAWSTVSSILSAFGKFWAYLKAVKAGPAACLFAEAVAAGVVALLDFITNFLLQKLSSATKGVGKRLKGMAQKIMDGLKKVGGGAKKAAGAAVNSARAAVRKARQALSRPGSERRPKGEPSPDLKSPVKPKDHATPKGPAKKPDGAETKPKERAPEKEQGPAKDRTPDKEKAPATDKTSESAPKKKQKEIEGPKPTKPKKPKSPVGRALSKAKGAVKSALKKVGNAAKTLGRKLKKSKLGKALKNGASKLRNFFKRKKDQFRDHKRRQQEQKRRNQDRRKKDEKSKESKEARLQRIIGRIRPRLQRMLGKGVGRLASNAVLLGLKTWYRLTELSDTRSSPFKINATLNPTGSAGEGSRAKVELSARLEEFLNKDPERRARLEQALNISTLDDWLLFKGAENADEFMMKIRRILKDLDKADQRNTRDKVLGTIRVAEGDTREKLRAQEANKGRWQPDAGEVPDEVVSQEEDAFHRVHMSDAIQRAKPPVIGDPSLPQGVARVAWTPEKMRDKVEFARKALALKKAGERGQVSKFKSSADEMFLDEIDRQMLIAQFGEIAKRTKAPKKPRPSRDPDLATRLKDLSMKFKQLVIIRSDQLAKPKGRLFQNDVKERLKNMQADHTIELQSGGRDIYDNLRLIDKGMNQKMGAQIKDSVNRLDYGALYGFDIQMY